MSVLIPDGETWDAVKAMRCLDREPTIKTHVLAKTRLPLARFSRYCSSCHRHASWNDDDWIRVIKNLVQRFQIDVVLPVTERGMEFVARNQAAIREFTAIPPIPDFKVLMTAHDKWSFYCFARQHGFAIPSTILVGKAGETTASSLVIDSIKYPALLKPTLLAGGFGIIKVSTASDFQRAWNDKRVIRGQQYILQSYVSGTDICLNAFCKNGEILAYAIQRSLFSPDNIFGPQRMMDFIENTRIIEVGTRLLSALKWDGIACVDFRLDECDQTEKILEINPRLGQAILGCLIAGVNFPLMACLGAVDMKYPNIQRHAVRYAHPIPHGKKLISQFMGKRTPVKIKWREGGLQFTVRDPIPEFIDIAHKIKRNLRSRI